jgi:cellulose synthase/poly-beta-1,6-N-acetylglucosamine synthase-like glycosyltransferase
MIYVLYSIVLVICVYTGRHYWFTLNRLFGFQRHPYIDIDTADWPPVTVLVAAHNEEKVIANILDALMTVKYPADKMIVRPIGLERLSTSLWRIFPDASSPSIASRAKAARQRH